MKKLLWVFAVLLFGCAGKLQAQSSASFNFSAGTQTISGWTNVPGDPSTGVRSATSNGITVSSVATANWAPLAGTGAAFDNIGSSGGTFFSPSAVMLNHWFQYSAPGAYNELVPQLQVSGLTKDSVYTLRMTASSSNQVVRGDHNSNKSNPGKHDKRIAIAKREQKAADAAKEAAKKKKN